MKDTLEFRATMIFDYGRPQTFEPTYECEIFFKDDSQQEALQSVDRWISYQLRNAEYHPWPLVEKVFHVEICYMFLNRVDANGYLASTFCNPFFSWDATQGLVIKGDTSREGIKFLQERK